MAWSSPTRTWRGIGRQLWGCGTAAFFRPGSPRDPRRDLTSLVIEASGLPAATPGDARALRPGDLVFALGNPLGWTGALSLGVVHAAGGAGPGSARRWIRADIRLAPGNSGGPLADARGHVVGINTMIARGLGLAIPTGAVERFLLGDSSRRVLGVTIRPVAVRVRGAGQLGLLVLEVARGGLAAEAGILPGDVLTGMDRESFGAPDDLLAALGEAEPGDTLELELIRSGGRIRRTLVIPPGERARAA